MSARATEFLIWRVATSVDWDCTVKDIADELGLDRSTVQHALKRRGWTSRVLKDSGGRGHDRVPVNWYMRRSGAWHV